MPLNGFEQESYFGGWCCRVEVYPKGVMGRRTARFVSNWTVEDHECEDHTINWVTSNHDAEAQIKNGGWLVSAY